MGTQEELCRPCVDCGLYTGCYCDGNDWGDCFAADRLPREHWANNQRTPLCTACDRRFGMCHFCRGQLWACPPAHRDPARYAPDAGAVPSRSFTWLKKELSLSKVEPQPLLDRSISLPRTILAVTTTCSSGRLLKEPEVWLLQLSVARGIRKPSRRRLQLRSRPTTRTMLRLAMLAIRLVRAVLKRRSLQMLPFARPSGTLSVCLEQLLSMTIPSRSPPPQVEIPLRISPNFDRGEYRSSDVFDRMDVAVVGDANAHTR